MSDTARRVIAIIALVFVAVFTVTMLLGIGFPDLLKGQIGNIALVSGGLGLPLWFILYLDNKKKKANEQITEDGQDKDETKDEQDEDTKEQK